jgi:hypothetical protein
VQRGVARAGGFGSLYSAILDFMNSEDHSKKMPMLVEYTALLDRSRGTDFFGTFPELAPYWIRYESVRR